MKTMNDKGYSADVEFDDEDGIFVGVLLWKQSNVFLSEQFLTRRIQQ